MTETRLRIPALFHNEALNGVVAPGFTAFPTPIGLAVTWDPAAVEEMAGIMRRQLRAVGLLHALPSEPADIPAAVAAAQQADA